MSDQQDINIYSDKVSAEDVSHLKGAVDQIRRIMDSLAAGNEFHVRATGKELRPFIHPGDLLVFVSTNFVKLSEGDFVLFRNASGVPSVRRVIRKCFIEGQATVITRSDIDMNDREQIRAAQVLARLTHVERHGQKIRAWRLNRGLRDWLTHFGTRNVFSRFTDFFLSLFPIRKKLEGRRLIEEGLVAAPPEKKSGKNKDPFKPR